MLSIDTGKNKLFLILLVLLGVSIAVSTYMSTIPSKTTSIETSYQFTHSAYYSYKALLKPNMLYNKTVVGPGTTLFTRLLRELNITLQYEARSTPPTMHGSRIIEVYLENPDVWTKKLETIGGGAFDTRFREQVVLNFTEITSLIKILESETGFKSSEYVLRVKPKITVMATYGNKSIVDTFTPELRITIDTVKGRVTLSGLNHEKVTSRNNTTTTPTYFSVLGGSIRVSAVKAFSYSSVLFLGAGFFFIAYRSRIREEKPLHAIINEKYSDLILEAKDVNGSNKQFVIKIGEPEELARIATRLEKPIIHVLKNGEHVYMVADSETLYVLRISNS